MTTLDIILMAPVAFAGILGGIKGFVRQLGTILGILFAILAALKWGSWAAEQMLPLTDREDLRNIIGPIIMFITVYFAFMAAGKLLNTLICFAKMGWADRTAGFIFGAFGAALPIGGLLMLLTMYIPSTRPAISSSRAATYLMHTVDLLYGHFRNDISSESEVQTETMISGTDVESTHDSISNNPH